ncbi:hypothetical protein D5085_10110 [Ectothiorhodospiraceae bacterium BW-2]|nr:hypothetical protein D5085_10110 [Ectothiorhodospiraceae bacterium BW-2]
MKTMIITLLLLSHLSSGYALEVAPRLTDREIIESLADLKSDIARVDQRFDAVDQRFDAVNQRFDAVNQRFDAVNQRIDSLEKQTSERFDAMEKQTAERFDAMEKQTNARFDAIDQRFEQMNAQFDKLWNLMLVIIAGVFGLIGFVVWDRKTALKPLEQRLERLEMSLQQDFEIQHRQGSKMTRLINALKELAQSDPKLQGVLRSFSLL